MYDNQDQKRVARAFSFFDDLCLVCVYLVYVGLLVMVSYHMVIAIGWFSILVWPVFMLLYGFIGYKLVIWWRP